MPKTRERTNSDRVATAEIALTAACRDRGDAHEPTAVTDLLTDLRHYCDSNDIDFAACLHASESHWWAEIRNIEPRDPPGWEGGFADNH